MCVVSCSVVLVQHASDRVSSTSDSNQPKNSSNADCYDAALRDESCGNGAIYSHRREAKVHFGSSGKNRAVEDELIIVFVEFCVLLSSYVFMSQINEFIA